MTVGNFTFWQENPAGHTHSTAATFTRNTTTTATASNFPFQVFFCWNPSNFGSKGIQRHLNPSRVSRAGPEHDSEVRMGIEQVPITLLPFLYFTHLFSFFAHCHAYFLFTAPITTLKVSKPSMCIVYSAEMPQIDCVSVETSAHTLRYCVLISLTHTCLYPICFNSVQTCRVSCLILP